MALRLTRNKGESWRNAALRAARPYGLEAEVERDYDEATRRGEKEEEAAWQACYEWDILDYSEEE